jgi:uncharacterized protein (DUF983 family)
LGDAPPGSAPVGLARVALAGRCPSCGNGRLFAGVIGFAPRCDVCGLDYASFNVGDGAASFLILIIGAIVTGLAMWLELSVAPPWYVHAALWLPLTLMLTLGLLRVAKALLLALEYRHSAREGRL